MQNYKEVYATDLQNLRSFLKQNVKRDEAISSWEYYNKYLQLTTAYDEAREQSPFDGIEMAYGDYSSPVMLILPNFESAASQLFIKKIREYLESISNESRTYRFSELCLVSYGKGATSIDNVKLLGYEIGILKPKVILSLVKMNVPGMDVHCFDLTPQSLEDDQAIAEFLSVIPVQLSSENKKAS